MFLTGVRPVVLFYLLCIAACSENTTPRTPLSPSPVPPSASVTAVTQTTQLRAVATFSNGTSRDVTDARTQCR